MQQCLPVLNYTMLCLRAKMLDVELPILLDRESRAIWWSTAPV
ncbi:MAG: hypothetical protein VB140_10050 [Burkholderia sp.]